MTQDIADDDEYFLPLEDQRVFGAGIKRKRVPFVPSSSNLHTTTTTNTTSLSAPATPGPSSTSTSGRSIADKYLSIVLSAEKPASYDQTATPSSSSSTENTSPTTTCDICNLPLSSKHPHAHPHESSLAHQLSLPHSHPPSAINRSGIGYKYLASYGWDADSRRGLGATGQGIRVPVKARVKRDTVGLGVKIPEKGVRKKEKEKKLGAKEVRRMEEEGRKRGERLREMFYREEEVRKYLGGE